MVFLCNYQNVGAKTEIVGGFSVFPSSRSSEEDEKKIKLGEGVQCLIKPLAGWNGINFPCTEEKQKKGKGKGKGKRRMKNELPENFAT